MGPDPGDGGGGGGLRAWIAFWKRHRDLLLGGDLVRMDGVQEGLYVHGVVAHDRSRALFAAVALDSLYPDPPHPLRLRGLDPERRYLLRPVFVERLPSGLHPPRWWGEPPAAAAEHGDPADPPSGQGFAGAVFPGAVLERIGVAAPRVHPDQVVLYCAERQDP